MILYVSSTAFFYKYSQISQHKVRIQHQMSIKVMGECYMELHAFRKMSIFRKFINLYIE